MTCTVLSLYFPLSVAGRCFQADVALYGVALHPCRMLFLLERSRHSSVSFYVAYAQCSRSFWIFTVLS